MYNTLNEAQTALNSINSTGVAFKADLLNLVKQVAVQTDCAMIVLYSSNVDSVYSGKITNDLIATGKDVRLIDHLLLGQFQS